MSLNLWSVDYRVYRPANPGTRLLPKWCRGFVYAIGPTWYSVRQQARVWAHAKGYELVDVRSLGEEPARTIPTGTIAFFVEEG